MPSQNEAADHFNQQAPVLFGVLAWICATVMVLLVWRNEQAIAQRESMVELNSEAVLVESLVKQRLDAMELIMRGGASLISGNTLPTADQWQGYVSGLDLGQRYSAVLGIGYGPYINRADLPRFQQDWRDRTGELISIRPWGVRAEYAPVLFLATSGPGQEKLLGLDMYVEATRHEAMQRAMESGRPWLSGPVTLYRDTTAVPSMIFYTPVYRGGVRPMTVAARRAEMNGWVYIPFRVQQFLDMTVKSVGRKMKLRISDETDTRRELVIAEDPGLTGRGAWKLISRSVPLYGRILRLDFFGDADVGIERSAWVLWGGLPLALAAGVITFLLARTQARAQVLARDMTRAQARSEALFRSAMVHSGIGMALLDDKARVVEVNPAFTQLFELGADALRGTHFSDLLDQGSVGPAEQGEQNGMRQEIRRFARRNGELRHVSLVYGKIPQGDGVDVKLLVQAEDISERVRNEARIRALNRTLELRVDARTRELSEANHQLETFAYSVSHDLRAPLRAIDGFSRLLSERHATVLDDVAQGYLARIRNGARRMDDLIGAILKISRIGRGELQRHPIDLSALAQDVVEELAATDPQRNFEVEIEPGLEVVGDPSLVRTLMQNLIGNAWKFTQGRDPARIHFGRDQGSYFVEDNGVGFEPAYAGKLFQPFQRLHGESEFAGHGIGLATVRRIVERHGGTIHAQGEVDRGARFIFTLPDVPVDHDDYHV
ncbi:CHASE domain-containing protein [Solilutibacter silvestris]|uniref:histidine kinase n=1 Tax=Solilutibacter silvestris TaxID=1645665 RepID=A0A2K1PZ44_9GAMM|nr:CHASE domain-containing protein [Lysobacter silvestris]PNS08068.1 PAS domain-containing S-box protein [Lysobacter silvestris]